MTKMANAEEDGRERRGEERSTRRENMSDSRHGRGRGGGKIQSC